MRCPSRRNSAAEGAKSATVAISAGGTLVRDGDVCCSKKVMPWSSQQYFDGGRLSTCAGLRQADSRHLRFQVVIPWPETSQRGPMGRVVSFV